MEIRIRARHSPECKLKHKAVGKLRRTPPVRRAEWLRSKYGLSPEDYDAMYQQQSGRCGMCDVEHGLLYVDHCHATGRVRGLLCRDCNFAIGHLRDNPVTALAAAIYLLAN
ncbi:endonuclease VII domain-containing protein [Streptomyces sp. 1222.5]|uniref:endonuclease VII domain-containing protein n=1 Tax=Streptomyces sp. 1222.5 TaxID=1881026 RepID=UPI003D74A438